MRCGYDCLVNKFRTINEGICIKTEVEIESEFIPVLLPDDIAETISFIVTEPVTVNSEGVYIRRVAEFRHGIHTEPVGCFLFSYGMYHERFSAVENNKSRMGIFFVFPGERSERIADKSPPVTQYKISLAEKGIRGNGFHPDVIFFPAAVRMVFRLNDRKCAESRYECGSGKKQKNYESLSSHKQATFFPAY